MRSFLLLSICLSIATAQEAVVVVGDPIAQLNHTAEIAKWVESIQKLNTQIQQMQQTIQIAETMKSYVGNPASAASAVSLDLLSDSPAFGQLTSQINSTITGSKALSQSFGSLFEPVDQSSPSGFPVTLSPERFKSFEAIQKQAANTDAVISETTSRIDQLRQEKARTMSQIKAAASQSEVQKLQAQLNALDGEIASLDGMQAAASRQLESQDIANRNDRDLKADAASQAADQEMVVTLDNYSQWQGQLTGSRQPFE